MWFSRQPFCVCVWQSLIGQFQNSGTSIIDPVYQRARANGVYCYHLLDVRLHYFPWFWMPLELVGLGRRRAGSMGASGNGKPVWDSPPYPIPKRRNINAFDLTSPTQRAKMFQNIQSKLGLGDISLSKPYDSLTNLLYNDACYVSGNKSGRFLKCVQVR